MSIEAVNARNQFRGKIIEIIKDALINSRNSR
jgi:molybdopterin-binding protein